MTDKLTPTPLTDALRNRMAEWIGNRQARAHEADAIVTCENLERELAGPRAKVEWQPIETAPKGKEVLVWREDSGTFIAKFTTPDAVMNDREIESAEFPDDFEEWFSDAHGWQEGSEKPTHWQPLPAPPAGKG